MYCLFFIMNKITCWIVSNTNEWNKIKHLLYRSKKTPKVNNNTVSTETNTRGLEYYYRKLT